MDQLNRIFKDLGTPNTKIWSEYSTLPLTRKISFTNYPYNRLQERFDTTLSKECFDLLNKFLIYDPPKRIAAEAALKHKFFYESPRPVDQSRFPTWPSHNERNDKRNRVTHSISEFVNAAPCLQTILTTQQNEKYLQ
jgi:cell division cycle 2-like protein